GDNGGGSWVGLAGLRALPSADTWSFPPRPHTHHVRWIEADVSVADRVFVAIEAGALVGTFDGGRTWRDRVRGGPYDTHTAMTHPLGFIVASCRGNNGGTGMRCQLHRIGPHSAGTTMNQDRLSLFHMTMGEKSLPCSLGGHRH